LPVQTIVNSIALVIQAVVNAITPVIQAVIDSIAAMIQSIINAVAPGVQTLLDSVAVFVNVVGHLIHLVSPHGATENSDAGDKQSNFGEIPYVPCIHGGAPFIQAI